MLIYSGEEPTLGRKQQLYLNIYQTFQSCDAKGTRQLNQDQYVQSWRLLGQKGTEKDARLAFER